MLMFKLTWWCLVLELYMCLYIFSLIWCFLYGFIALLTWGKSTRSWKLRTRYVFRAPVWF